MTAPILNLDQLRLLITDITNPAHSDCDCDESFMCAKHDAIVELELWGEALLRENGRLRRALKKAQEKGVQGVDDERQSVR